MTSHDLVVTEGYSQQIPRLKTILEDLVRDYDVQLILEIGMNGGHSSEIFLRTHPFTKVISFDIGHHDYVRYGKSYLDQTFPFRHSLILGDSSQTIVDYPHFHGKVDLIYIDGGHEYLHAIQDIYTVRVFLDK